VEITREIARRFNHLFGPVFPEPDAILTETPKILGLDRRKMSKSYGNAIYLADSPEEMRKKVMQMVTDPQRMRRSDPGNPEVCNVFAFHNLYTDQTTVQQIDPQCRQAEIGCVQCKQIMAENLIKALAPLHEKRQYYESNPDIVDQIIAAGGAKARRMAGETMAQVKDVLKMNY
jgi:tryptophanyl-tRNA synthetase